MTTEDHKQLKYRIDEPSLERYICKMLPQLKLTQHCGKGGGKIIRARGSDILLWGCVS